MQSNTGSEEHLETPILQYAGGVIAAKLDRTEKELVHGVSFHISRGESLALIGETGSGKTLIAQSVMGVLPGNVRLVSGEVLFCGKALPKGKKLRSMLGREIVYIPQNGHEFLDPSRSIRRQMFDSIAKLGIAAPLREAFAREKLTQVGFTQPEAILDRYAFQLSGGMAQRVTIALALCSQAKLLIADEPTNGLDQDSKQQTLSLLNEMICSRMRQSSLSRMTFPWQRPAAGSLSCAAGKCWRLAAPHWCWLPRAIPTPKPCWVPWWKTGCRKRRFCGRRRALVPSIAAVPQPSDDAVPKYPGGRWKTENGGAARNDLHGTDR